MCVTNTAPPFCLPKPCVPLTVESARPPPRSAQLKIVSTPAPAHTHHKQQIHSIFRPVSLKPPVTLSFRPPMFAPPSSVRSHWTETSTETAARHDQGCKRSFRRLQVITPETTPRALTMAAARTQPLLTFVRHTCSTQPHTNKTFDCVPLFTVIASYRRKLLLSTLIRNAKLSLMLYESWNKSKLK